MNKHLIIAGMLALSISSQSQTITSLSAQDYQNAENFLSYKTENLVTRNILRPNWLPGDKLWYAVTTERGNEFIVVDPVKKTRVPAFDQVKLAEALSKTGGRNYEAYKLPLQTIYPAADGKSVSFIVDGKKWNYNPGANT